MKPIHLSLILFSMILIVIMYDIRTFEENNYMKKHKECMQKHSFMYTDQECAYCDSIIKNQ